MIGNRVKVIRYEPKDPRLGRHVEHDNRSKSFAFIGRQSKPEKVTTHWTSDAPPLDQGNIGSCTGTSMCQWLNTDFALGALIAADKVEPGNFFDQKDAIEIYSKATRLDTLPGVYNPDDPGSTGNAACKAAKEFGYIDGYSWLFSFGSVQAAIEKTPLLVGTVWTEKMSEPRNGLLDVGPIVQSKVMGGHEYLMTGIDWENEVFEFRQSWGEWEGAKPGGYFAITFWDFVKLLDQDADISVPKLGGVPDEQSQESSDQG